MSLLHATEQEKSPKMIALDAAVKERVLRGLAFLKKTYGEDYVEHINLDTLDLRSASMCVLGQTHPAYYPDSAEWSCGYDAATDKFFHGRGGNEFGFNTNHNEEWDILQKQWEDVLADEKSSYKRKKAAGLV